MLTTFKSNTPSRASCNRFTKRVVNKPNDFSNLLAAFKSAIAPRPLRNEQHKPSEFHAVKCKMSSRRVARYPGGQPGSVDPTLSQIRNPRKSFIFRVLGVLSTYLFLFIDKIELNDRFKTVKCYEIS